MIEPSAVLSVVHVTGLALGMGAATVKFIAVARSRDPKVARAFLELSRWMTLPIVLGMILLTLSGIGWMLLGHPLSSALSVKLALVAALWVIGPWIDRRVEPPFARALAAAGDSPSPAFARAHRRFLAFEAVATGLFYVIVLGWMLR
jgi:hypothetical protein